MHFRSVCLSDEPVGGRFPAIDGQHDSAIWPSVWLIPTALPPYPGASEGIGLPGVDSLGCCLW